MIGRISNQPNSRGFTLFEVLVISGIGLLVMSFTIPTISAVVASAKLGASMTSLSGLLQNCRMVAVQENKTKTAYVVQSSGGLVGYIKDATGGTTLSQTDYQIKMEAPILRYTSLMGVAGAPTALTSTELGFTPQTTIPSFNSRGLPCHYASGICTSYGFISYYKDTRIDGSDGWAAISISPAGRIKRWFWRNSTWGD